MYLHNYLGYGMSSAAGMSAVFPAMGTVSVLFTGWPRDRPRARGRPLLLMLALAATAVSILAMLGAGLLYVSTVRAGES